MPKTQRLLELALKGLEAERVKLEFEIAEIRRELNQDQRRPTIERFLPFQRKRQDLASER